MKNIAVLIGFIVVFFVVLIQSTLMKSSTAGLIDLRKTSNLF